MSSRPRAAARLSGFGTSIFTEMSRLAVEHRAVNLGQGFPDFPAPAFVKEAAKRAIDAELNQYAPAPGIPRLRAQIARHWQVRHGVALDPDSEITVTQGATEGLAAALLGIVNPGDEVIVMEPAYDAYVPDILLAGGVPVPVRLHPPGFALDAAALAAAVTPRTRVLIVNTPHNPTGKVLSAGELDQIAALCVRHDLVALSDEVYSEIVFAGARHVPLATRPGMRERTVTIDSMGKTFGVTGWKIGWVVATPELTRAVRATHQFLTFCNSTPFQEAAADALTQAHDNGYFDELRAAYLRRRDQLRDLLEEVGLPPLPIEGAYFLLSDLSGTGFSDDVTFCRHLLTEVGVAAIPPSAFYLDARTAPLLTRFCFAKSDATLAAAAERLRSAARAGKLRAP